MSRSQRRPVRPPDPTDTDLRQHAAVVQDNVGELFDLAHDHIPTTEIPGERDGEPGDIKLIENTDAGTFWLYARFSSGWKRVELT